MTSTAKVCSIDDCGQPVEARGWCKAHYSRWWKHGDVQAEVPVGVPAAHPLRGTWYAMIDRCHNPKSGSYPYYGGRGISVCERWRESLDAFLEDMGERPEGCSLERVDNDGNYEPQNVIWATRSEQLANRRFLKEACPKGHPYPENIIKDSRGASRCATCTMNRAWNPERAEYQKAYRARKRAEKEAGT